MTAGCIECGEQWVTVLALVGLTDPSGKRGLASPAGATCASFVRPDALLSLAVGGAGALFVATDESFGAANWAGLFTILDEDGYLAASCKAGASTAVGLLVLQLVQNLVLPRGVAWLD